MGSPLPFSFPLPFTFSPTDLDNFVEEDDKTYFSIKNPFYDQADLRAEITSLTKELAKGYKPGKR